MTTSPPRLPCCAPFCRRTTGKTGFSEWICADHWRAVPRRMRAMKFRIEREAKRSGWTEARIARAARIWNRIKRAAIERAAGIG